MLRFWHEVIGSNDLPNSPGVFELWNLFCFIITTAISGARSSDSHSLEL
jgi:hypothetical protein